MEHRYTVRRLSTAQEAEAIAAFLLSEHSFDDTRHTPGELDHFRTTPFKALAGEMIFQYVRDEAGGMIGVNSFMENEQQTGGYCMDYLVVHKQYRKQGISTLLVDQMLQTLRELRARYVMTYTCDLEAYRPVQRLFGKFAFELVGRCPDYYYAGEDRLIYYRKI